MFEETRRLESPTGASLAYHHQAASGAACGVLLICHGMVEHSGRYGDFAHSMDANGFHVYVHDHRGHGVTTAPDAVRGRFAVRDGAAKALDDVWAMRNLATDAHPDLPVILFGHSMGGLIALNAACDHPEGFQGLAIWNSNFNQGVAGRLAQLVLHIEKALMGADVPSAILPRATFRSWGRSIPNWRTESDWLNSIPAEVDAYLADPLCGFDASISLWLDILRLTFRGPTVLGRLPRGLPIHLVGGEDDPATNKGREVLWLKDQFHRRGFQRVTSRIWPGTRHETLKEIVRREAMDDFMHWARAAVASQTE
ncbi:alpha/beta fold hydrolase [Pseudorhizobium flavum]|uniref:alpha/beta fold hydrolase n=1 Tax=Pseudorhizobium flavum TaxID=1335061 RepID=UPI00248F69EF|nr:alpha/beta hydrolase [Pseudorhizobium flavum]